MGLLGSTMRRIGITRARWVGLQAPIRTRPAVDRVIHKAGTAIRILGAIQLIVSTQADLMTKHLDRRFGVRRWEFTQVNPIVTSLMVPLSAPAKDSHTVRTVQ